MKTKMKTGIIISARVLVIELNFFSFDFSFLMKACELEMILGSIEKAFSLFKKISTIMCTKMIITMLMMKQKNQTSICLK